MKNDFLNLHPLTQSHRVNKMPVATIHRVNQSQPVNKKQKKIRVKLVAMKKFLLSTFAFCLFNFSFCLSNLAFAQPTFEKIFRVGNQSTEVYSVFPLNDGYMLISKHGKSNINFTKLDSNGEFVTGKDVFDTNSGFVMSTSVTSSGNFLVTGVVNVDKDSENTSQTGFLLKVSSDLNSVTAFNFVPFAGNGDTWASGARETSDGNIIVLAKSTVTSVGGIDNYFEVIKLDKSLDNIIWQKAILAGSDNTVFDIAETSAGYEIYGAIKHKDTNWNLYLGSISKDGSSMKRQLIMGGNDWDGAYDFMADDGKQKVRNHASSIVNIDGNNLAVAAYSRSYGSNPTASDDKVGKSIIMISVPVTGDSYNWVAKLDGGKNDQVFGPFGGGNFISLTNGDLLLSGYTNSTSTSSPYPGAFVYRFAAQSNGNLTPKWQHVFTPPNNMFPLGISETASGSLLITGRSGASTEEGVIIETTSEGINPVGCISANFGDLNLSSLSLSVMSTTNAALFDGTLLTQNALYAQLLRNATTITTICGAQSTDDAEVPFINMQPQGQSIASGERATLSVLSTGTPPIHYQWYEGESGVESNPVGADSTVFTTPVLTESTSYWVKISNAAGEVNSATVTVTVGNIKWAQNNLPDYKQLPFILTLGVDENVFVTSMDVVTQFGPNDWPCSSPPGDLTAINSNDGTVLWNINVGHTAPPAIADNGTIYTNIENRFYGINPQTGIMNLIYTADRSFTSSPAIGADGTVFIGAGQKVMAIDPTEKKLIWEEATDKFVIHHPSIGSDGTVYVIPWIVSSKMYAFYPHKSMNQVKWTTDIQGFFTTPPVVGEKGTIYAGAKHVLYAFSPESGSKKWHFTTPIAPAGYPEIHTISAEPVVSNNGTIYFATTTIDDTGGALFAIHPEGYPKWFFPSGPSMYFSPVLAKDETIYYQADKLYVLDLFGKEMWSNETVGPIAPALGSDGTIYASSKKAFGVLALEGNSGGLMTAYWPCFGSNAQNTSLYDDSFVGIPPKITMQPENKMIKSGESATFKVSASGDPVISYQWYEGILGDKSKPLGQDSVYTTPPLDKMTNYWVEVSNEFGRDASITVMASTGSEGEVKWFYNTNPTFNREEDGEIMGGVALADDGTLYFGVYDCRLFAMNPDGTLKWIANVQAYNDKYKIEYGITPSTPTIGPDGTIYVNTLGYYDENYSYQHDFGILWAINPDGSEKWRYEAGNMYIGDEDFSNPWLRYSPAVGHDGTIYVVTESGELHAVNSDGSLKWKFKPHEHKDWTRGTDGSPASIGSDGTIYYAAGGYSLLNEVSNREALLFAINPDGTFKWDFMLLEGKVFFGSYPPSIGPDGKIYIDNGDGYVTLLHAINPDGTEAWQFHLGENAASSVVIGTDSTVYIGGSTYISPGSRIKLYALNHKTGEEKWRFPREGQPDKFSFDMATPVVGADGNIYVGIPSHSYGAGDGRIYALRPDGTEIWEDPPYVGAFGNSPPVIAPDGTLYVGTGEGYISGFLGFLFAINTSAFGVANTSWPMFGQNPQRIQRAPGFSPCEVPDIVLQPKDTTIFKGDAVKLTFKASGNDLTYQWYKGTDRSTPLGNDESLITSALNETSTFWVRVSNTCGFADSRMITIKVTNEGANIQETALSQILANNVALEGFSPSVLEYNYYLQAENEIPIVSALTATDGAIIEVIQATSINEQAIITVTSPDGATKRTYTINFNIGTGFMDLIDTEVSEIILYPNPATNRINLQSPCFLNEDIRLELVDVQGKKWIEKQFGSGKETIDINLSKLNDGVYFCKIYFEDKCVTKKVVVRR